MATYCLDYEVRIDLQQCQNEIIGVLRFDAGVCESSTRKVSQIERDDHACAASNRGSEDVTIIPIRQLN